MLIRDISIDIQTSKLRLAYSSSQTKLQYIYVRAILAKGFNSLLQTVSLNDPETESF